MADYNRTRVNKLAKRLPRLRRPSSREKNHVHSSADVDEYNNRQVMPCKETRARWDSSSSAGPVGGSRYATTVALVEKARRIKQPTIEHSAYLAWEEGRQSDIERLVDRMEEILNAAAVSEKWRYYDPNPLKPKTRMLASIIVEQWLSPSKYWRERESGVRPIISSFALVIGCDNKTWHKVWKHRFERHREVPQGWYEAGKVDMTGTRID